METAPWEGAHGLHVSGVLWRLHAGLPGHGLHVSGVLWRLHAGLQAAQVVKNPPVTQETWV